MATNKGKNTTAVKPRRFGVGIILSCVQRLRRRQPKAPQVLLERSLATTVRRGSGRKTVPLDSELVEMASTSLDGGGEIKEVDVGAGEEEISLIVEDPSANDKLRSLEVAKIAAQELLFDNNDTLPTNITAENASNVSGDQSLASPKQEPDQSTHNTEDLAENTTTKNASNVFGDRSLGSAKQKPDQNMHNTEDLAGNTMAENANNVSGDQSLASPKQELDQSMQNTEDLAENATIKNASNVSDDRSLASLKQEHEQNMQNIEDLAGNTMAKNTSNVSNDQQTNNGTLAKNTKAENASNVSGDQSLASPKQEHDESMQNTGDLAGNKMTENASNVSRDQSSASPKQEIGQNTHNTEDLAGNTMAENSCNVSGDQHLSKLDESWKEEIDEIKHDLGEKSETQMNSDDPTMEIPISSYKRDLDAQLIPLLHSSLPNKTTDQTPEDLEETIEQNTEDWAVNIKQEQSSTISNDYQETDEKPRKQYPDNWKHDMDAGRSRTTGDVSSKLTRLSSAPSPSLPDQPTIKTHPTISSPQQSDENSMATNRDRKEEDNLALPLEAELADNIEEVSKISLPTSSPLSLFRELLPWSNQHSSLYGYLLLPPIGMAVMFLIVLLSVGIFAFLLFAVPAVAGMAMLPVWVGILWALWMSARVGLTAIKFLVSAMVYSISRASSAFDL